MFIQKFILVTIFLSLLAGCGRVKPNVFRSSGCNLESIANAKAVNDSTYSINKSLSNLFFVGWAIDPLGVDLPNKFFIVLEDVSGNTFIAGEASPSISRGDVSAAFNKPGIDLVGFNIHADFSSLPMGTYSISINQAYPVKNIICNFNKSLIIQ